MTCRCVFGSGATSGDLGIPLLGGGICLIWPENLPVLRGAFAVDGVNLPTPALNADARYHPSFRPNLRLKIGLWRR